MGWWRQWLDGLGAEHAARPIVWIDASEVGLVDLGLARPDLVIVPAYGDRLELTRAVVALTQVHTVVEVERADRQVRSRVIRARPRAVVVWDEVGGTRRWEVVPPGAARWLRLGCGYRLGGEETLQLAGTWPIVAE